MTHHEMKYAAVAALQHFLLVAGQDG